MTYLDKLQGDNKPILQKIAYDNRFQQYAGFSLFPIAKHPLNVGQIAKFKEKYIVEDSRRAMGASAIRVEDDPDDFVPFTIEEREYERAVDDREWMNALEPMKSKLLSEQSKLKYLQNRIALEIELLQAKLATTIANYGSGHNVTLSENLQFNNYSNSDPLSVIETAKLKVATEANVSTSQLTCLMSINVYTKLKNHPAIMNLLSSSERKLMSEEKMKQVLELKNLVIGAAKYKTAGGTIASVWGNDIIFAYVPDNINSLEDAAFGATVRQDGYPIVKSYREERASSDVLKYKDALEPVIIDSASGYLIKNAVA